MTLFRPNKNFREQIMTTETYRDGMTETLEPVRQTAETFATTTGAPWMPTQGYRDRPVVIEKTTTTILLVLTGHGAHLQEWGSSNNPPHAPLRRAVQAAGLKLTEQQ